MSEWMDLLRGPVFGVIVMIILMAGVLVVAAIAALFAQMGLLLRLRPWKMGSESGERTRPQEPSERQSAAQSHQREPASAYRSSPQMVVCEPNGTEVVDADWWQVVE